MINLHVLLRWCQFIYWLNHETLPSSLHNSKMANMHSCHKSTLVLHILHWSWAEMFLDWKTWYQQKPSCSFIKLLSYHILLTVTSPGISARKVIGESLSVYKKEDSGRFLRTNFLATRNYWQKQTYHRCTTDVYRILLSSCIRLSINYCLRLCNLFQLDSGSYHLRKREFVQPRFFSVTYGKHSLRYLGPKLWNDLTPRIRNLPSLKQFKSVIRNQDLTALAANVSDCRGCKLCREWLIDYRSFTILIF